MTIENANTDVIVDEMVLDMGAIDFFSLEDSNISVKDQPATKKAKVEATKVKEEVEADADADEEGEDNDNFDFDEINENDVVDEDEDDSEEDEEEVADDADEEESADTDEEEVDYEGYEVTLPSGETVKLSDAVRGYQDSKKLEAERKEFESIRDKFGEESQNVTRYLELAKLEAQRVIEDYEDFDWIDLAKTDHSAYVDNKIFLEKYQQRYNEIVKSMDEVKNKESVKVEEAHQLKARDCIAVLEKDLSGWGEPLYRQLMEYAVENGASADDIVKCVDPMVFKVLHKAMQFDKGKATVTAKIKKAVTSPTKVVKATAKVEKAPNTKKSTALNKIKSGQITSQDVSAMFDLLED